MMLSNIINRAISSGFLLLTLNLLSACEQVQPNTAIGLVEWDRLELTAETNEPIISIAVQEGQQLTQGQILLTMDARKINAQLDEANAAMRETQARLAELKRGTRQELISETKSKLEGAESEKNTASNEFDRAQSLVLKKLASIDSLDRARSVKDQAIAKYNSTKSELERLLAGVTVEELRQAEARLEQTQARIRALKITLDRLTLVAPTTGRLDTLPYKVGERPPTGAVVAIMLSGQAPYARVYVPETIRVHVKYGTKVNLSIDGLKATYAGHVRKISQDPVFTPYYSLTKADRSRLAYVAEIQIDNQKASELSSGVPVTVQFLFSPDKLR